MKAPSGELTARGHRGRILPALALLYVTQGIPLGLAAEYLPVVLRKSGYSLAQIAALSWLQLPWQLKILYAGVADRPSARAHARSILLGLQLSLACSVALYAAFDLRRGPMAWFVLTVLAALFAATQDLFVDALAVRVLRGDDRGFGNVAQVAGYRMGILIGGAGLLVVVGTLGAPTTVLVCASLIASAGVAAFVLRDEQVETEPEAARAERLALTPFLRHLAGRGAWPILAIACTFKLGLHIASVLIKPMVVDAHWTEREIGIAVVTTGTVCGLLGAGIGGLVHKKLSEPRALGFACLAQALACTPLIFAATLGVPRGLTIASIAMEHFASGVGTTVLFAALMSATRPANAGLHYTILTSCNAFTIGLGAQLGGFLGHRLGFSATFGVAAVVSAAPIVLLPRWRSAVEASRGRVSTLARRTDVLS